MTRIIMRRVITAAEVYNPGGTPREVNVRNDMTVSRLVTDPPARLTRASEMRSEAIMFKMS